MELNEQRDLVQRFRSWYEGGQGQQGASLKVVIEDNRRRYRMLLSDAAERIERGLSALPSTKSTSTVDNAVIDAIQEYYETDAIAFNAQDSGDINKDHLARWLTEFFKYRCNNTFPFWVWHIQSLKAGLVDGIEAAFVRWRKESYDYQEHKFFNAMTGEEVDEDFYKAAMKMPEIVENGVTIQPSEMFHKQTETKTRNVTDTWFIDQLKPGENLLWDFKNPVLDINYGQWAIVIQYCQKDEILGKMKDGIFDKLPESELEPFLQQYSNSLNQADYTDYTALATDPDSVDMGDYNLCEVWYVFYKEDSQWKYDASLRGDKELVIGASVNKDFFGGRRFDRLPIVMGAGDIELWEAIGRGIPKLIGPLEDELTDHKNNVNDMAKLAAQGKYRLRPDSDVDIDMLLNDKVFFADAGEVEKIDMAGDMAVVMKAAEGANIDIAEVAPVNYQAMMQKGHSHTLGNDQLSAGAVDKKLSTRLLVRNVTFMKPLLRIIAEMEFAFETDETIARIAAKQAGVNPQDVSTVANGKPMIDFRNLDFDVEVQINAGLGNVPKQQKTQKMLQLAEWARGHDIPIDLMEVYRQAKVLNGFNEDQFDPKTPPQPKKPPVDYKATINVDLDRLLELAPQAGMHLLQLLMEGHMDIDTKIKESKESKQRSEAIKALGADGSMSHPGVTQNAPQGQMGGL